MAAETTRDTLLLLGANGQVGHELHSALPSLGNVFAYDVPQIDFADPNALRALLREHRPEVIVNAAAYTAVDEAENEPDLAYLVNATAPGILAEEAKTLGAVLVHYSTDYVFDGSKSIAYVESDRTNPLSVYGKSKFKGEQAVRGCPRHLIFRTSWVVGAHGQNFIKTMLRLAGERDALRVVADQRGAPTSAALLADVTASVLTQMRGRSSDDPRWGLYHLVASGSTTWNGLARHVIARAAAHGLALKTKPEDVAPIATADYPTRAIRPANSRLDTAKLRKTFDLDPPDWTDGVDAALDRILEAMSA